MKRLLFALFAVLSVLVVACGGEQKPEAAKAPDCEKPVKDPNDPKPMALMMRTMADYCDTMRLRLLAGGHVDSVQFPLMPFKTAEPTDSGNLVPLFYENAARFEAAWRTLMADTLTQQDDYSLVIASCVDCHNSFCSGPLRRIKKLPLDYREER